MKKIYYLWVLLLPLLLCSCSTMMNTTSQEIHIKSEPSNAKLTIDGKKFGTTPQTVNIARGDDHVVKIELSGYEPYEIQITRRMSKWVWSNVLNGFIPGFAIDYLNGSLYNLYPGTLNITLSPAAPVIAKPAKK